MPRRISRRGFSFVEHLTAVAFDAFLHRKERRGETCAAQLADVRLSDGLVLPLQRVRKEHVRARTLPARLRQVHRLSAFSFSAAVSLAARHGVEAVTLPVALHGNV